MKVHDGLEAKVPLEVRVSGLSIRGFLHPSRGFPSGPCVILCHGLLSSMESPKFKLLASELSQAGISALRFDFRGCGLSQGDLTLSTVSARLDDLIAFIDLLRNQLGHNGPLGLMGSSMGGFVALLAGGQRGDVHALCTWATPFDPLEVVGLAHGSEARKLGPEFLEDLSRHKLHRLSGRIRNLLVIHGGKDELIPPRHAEMIYNLALEPKAIKLIEGADHRFSDPGHRRQATNLTVSWFLEELGLV